MSSEDSCYIFRVKVWNEERCIREGVVFAKTLQAAVNDLFRFYDISEIQLLKFFDNGSGSVDNVIDFRIAQDELQDDFS
jgi:hypothetical protein